MDTTKKYLESILKAKSFISAAHLQTAGWQAGQNSVDVVGPCIFLYVYDQPTKWTWMACVDLEAFRTLSQSSHDDKAAVETVRGGAAFVMSGAADGLPPDEVAGLKWEEQLAGLLTLYAGTTQTWELAQRFATGGHFIVLNYRKPKERSGMLRPFAMQPNGDKVLSVEELKEAIDQVIARDRQRNPQWFH